MILAAHIVGGFFAVIGLLAVIISFFRHKQFVEDFRRQLDIMTAEHINRRSEKRLRAHNRRKVQKRDNDWNS